VIFDVDGTLCPSTDLYVESLIAVASKFGINVDRCGVIKAFHHDERRILQNIGIPNSAWHIWVQTYKELSPRLCSRPYYGIQPLLYQLKRKGIPIALATNKSYETFEITLKALRLWRLFHQETLRHAVGSKVLTIRHHLTTFNVQPNEAALVGDSPLDVGAAFECGIEPIIVNRYDSIINWDLYPDEVAMSRFFETTRELRSYLLKAI